MQYIVAVAVLAKSKGPSTPEGQPASARKPMSSHPKVQHANKAKEKSHSIDHESRQPKAHRDGNREARQSHQTHHHSKVPKDRSLTKSSKDGPKEILLDVMLKHDRETGVRARRDGPSHHRSGTKHSEESFSKPILSRASVTAQHRLSSDLRLSAGRGAVDAKMASGGGKGEAKLSAKVLL